MSGGAACQCEERHKPMAQREWYVVQRNCNHSAFNGYHRTYSDYSSISCAKCPGHWRTKASFVSRLRDLDTDHWMATNQYREKRPAPTA